MASIGLLIEDLERLQSQMSQAAHGGVPSIVVDKYNTELLGRAAAALRAQRGEMAEEMAAWVEAEFQRVMALQKPAKTPIDDAAMCNAQIRMAAVMLPDIAATLRKMGEVRTL